MVNFAEGLNHRCGFLPSGGSAVLEIHRRSRRGQRAAEPGKIKTRKPTPLPIACVSIRRQLEAALAFVFLFFRVQLPSGPSYFAGGFLELPSPQKEGIRTDDSAPPQNSPSRFFRPCVVATCPFCQWHCVPLFVADC